MINQYALSDAAWTAVTTAGQSGTCWLDEQNAGAVGSMDVRLFHSSIGAPSYSDLTLGKRVYRPSGNGDVLSFDADSIQDIYYARCVSGTATISVDAV